MPKVTPSAQAKAADSKAATPPSDDGNTDKKSKFKKGKLRSETKLELEPSLQRKSDGKFRPYIRSRDKVMFVFSVMNVLMLSFFTAGFSWLLPYYYTAVVLPLLFARYWTYGRNKYTYFLLDFCYWGNFALLLYLWLPTFEYSDYFFACVYTFATGPMAWAVIIFRNAMVFHSLDKTISNFIHLGPLITVFALRWHSPIAENMSVNNTADIAGVPRDVFANNWTGFGRFKVCETDHPCFQEWYIWFFLVPAGAQLVWVFFYALSSRICCKIQEHHVDAFRFLTSRGAVLQTLGRWENRRLAYFVYNVINYASNVGMTLPAVLFYWNFYANLGLILLLVITSVWNGANFYIDVFSKKYLVGVKKREREIAARRRADATKNNVAASVSADPAPTEATTSQGDVNVV